MDEMEECQERERKLKERLKDIQGAFVSSKYFVLFSLNQLLKCTVLLVKLPGCLYFVKYRCYLFIQGNKMEEIMNSLAAKNSQIYIKRSKVTTLSKCFIGATIISHHIFLLFI